MYGMRQDAAMQQEAAMWTAMMKVGWYGIRTMCGDPTALLEAFVEEGLSQVLAESAVQQLTEAKEAGDQISDLEEAHKIATKRLCSRCKKPGHHRRTCRHSHSHPHHQHHHRHR
ncbi:hypothetical protein DUNSADRAFT_17843 [Dunaliella salina]|uniref:CCHC-type domain-containing protein n=1 Tax=Dunaliella salina TaxID=3046 RepID=A0ABQ7G106_DUNSA|nr:hypothetical protein DUNSADRAFT_17843 [Dunaliella salina]|eukprot:KAF5828295.1 hypothetical protein DUNSADRAFT_17843 [Dunaliella salina]